MEEGVGGISSGGRGREGISSGGRGREGISSGGRGARPGRIQDPEREQLDLT